MFNSLKYAKRLEEVGFTREQAEAHVQMMTEFIEGNFATSQNMKDLQLSTTNDMKDLQVTTSHDMATLRNELKQDMTDLRSELKQEIKDLQVSTNNRFNNFENKLIQLEYRLTIKLGAIVSVTMGLAVAIIKLL